MLPMDCAVPILSRLMMNCRLSRRSVSLFRALPRPELRSNASMARRACPHCREEPVPSDGRSSPFLVRPWRRFFYIHFFAAVRRRASALKAQAWAWAHLLPTTSSGAAFGIRTDASIPGQRPRFRRSGTTSTPSAPTLWSALSALGWRQVFRHVRREIRRQTAGRLVRHRGAV